MTRKRAWIAVVLVSIPVVVSSCGPAATRYLYYVHRAAACPPPAGIDTDKAAGFTSLKAAQSAARVETSGPRIFWQEHIAQDQRSLADINANTKLSASARAKQAHPLVAEIALFQMHLSAYANCTKYVIRGVPNSYPSSP
ncbi:MAG TPA: hypothetical protein VG815_14630 [Chloroflexota bacterium]|jgi:hypothetical protein|nr:hypothetical protein [Chloroflexota bacterium]